MSLDFTSATLFPGSLRIPTTRIPSALARTATALPMSPYPAIKTVFPASIPTGARVHSLFFCETRIAFACLLNQRNEKTLHSPSDALNAPFALVSGVCELAIRASFNKCSTPALAACIHFMFFCTAGLVNTSAITLASPNHHKSATGLLLSFSNTSSGKSSMAHPTCTSNFSRGSTSFVVVNRVSWSLLTCCFDVITSKVVFTPRAGTGIDGDPAGDAIAVVVLTSAR
mmetsp:Transcript_11714/g.38969  ORF Transcript_11714/g.38969 Transcript_11714/m.38969 type:complete len:228 (-) Transcript_11714:265-948(-)